MKFRHCQRLRAGHWEPIEFEFISPGDKIKMYEADGTFYTEFIATTHAKKKGKDGNWRIGGKVVIEKESKE